MNQPLPPHSAPSATRRRHFLRTAVAGTVLLSPALTRSAAADLGGAFSRVVARQMKVDAGAQVVAEPARRTPVAAEVDVLVVGGGPTGVGAALAAASEGAKTLLLERNAMLSGMWTAGLLNPFFDPRKGWLVDRLIEKLQQQGAWVRKGMDVFDVEMMKFVLERLMAEAGVEYWYNCPFTEPILQGERVRGVIVESKSGREALLAQVVIDCTGDGDVGARAGVPFERGRKSDGLCQPLTLMFGISGYEGFRGLPADRLTTHEFFKDLSKVIDEQRLPIQLPYGPQRSGTPFLIALPGKAVAVVQATHVYRVDATNVREMSRATAAARRQVHEVFLPAMRRIPGLENLRLSQTAPQIGVREARRLEGRYRLELDDMLQARRFGDAVTSVGFHVDLHELDPKDSTPKLPPFPPGVTRHTISKRDIPHPRCLLPKTLEGLLWAGRCISGSHEAHSAYRVTGTCMAMGQAAGLAAATAVRRKTTPSELDGAELHALLRARGAQFLPRGLRAAT
ncbi:MAG: FAD-dependent oxidoreductase [Verrucomicrobia bacterium]|nr:FAD-dependent oxidoreductase [Verrucomicrobiota bacterium]